MNTELLRARQIIDSSPSMGCVPTAVAGLDDFIYSQDFREIIMHNNNFVCFNIGHGGFGYLLVQPEDYALASLSKARMHVWIGSQGPMKDPARDGVFMSWFWSDIEDGLTWLQNISTIGMEHWSKYFNSEEIPEYVENKLRGGFKTQEVQIANVD